LQKRSGSEVRSEFDSLEAPRQGLNMAGYWTEGAAALGAVLGVANLGWTFWKAYRERARLSVEVAWDGIGISDAEGEPAPRVTVRNLGGRTKFQL
jgi:hypothetical protein